MVVYDFNPSTQGAEAGGSLVRDQPDLQILRTGKAIQKNPVSRGQGIKFYFGMPFVSIQNK